MCVCEGCGGEANGGKGVQTGNEKARGSDRAEGTVQWREKEGRDAGSSRGCDDGADGEGMRRSSTHLRRLSAGNQRSEALPRPAQSHQMRACRMALAGLLNPVE